MLCFLLFSRMRLGVASQGERVLYVRSVYLHGAGQTHRMVLATRCESPMLRHAAECRLPLPHIESPRLHHAAGCGSPLRHHAAGRS